jgi:hypothetical protein
MAAGTEGCLVGWLFQVRPMILIRVVVTKLMLPRSGLSGHVMRPMVSTIRGGAERLR